MKKFSDICDDTILDGKKTRIEDILNKEIEILAYKISVSKFSKNKNGKYLTLQIIDDAEKYVIFTGSDVLIDQLEKYGKELPFFATIRKINKYYTLT